MAFIAIPRHFGGLVGRGDRASLEHLQHPVGDPVAADDVCAGEGHGHEGEHAGERIVRRGRQPDGTHQHDAVDRVRARHQRRVERPGTRS